MGASLQDCVLLVKRYYKNYDCARVAQQKFRTLKGIKEAIGPIQIRSEGNDAKIETTGSFDVQSGRGRKRVHSTVVEEVATALQGMSVGGVQPCSAGGIARSLDRPTSTVLKIVRNILQCYPFKIGHVQELLPSDLTARETFE